MVCMWRSEDNSGNINICAHTFPCLARGLNFDKIQPIFKQTNKTLHACCIYKSHEDLFPALQGPTLTVLVLWLGSVIHLELNLADSLGGAAVEIDTSSAGVLPTLAVADKTTLPC